ncbi:hypothetical protein B0T21DRAFT_331655 [Apiosordaria backusii]|uniref:Uncharacterized protein n=1 Tax=Apiosordaria backusii TaxID=314023 RepID=A0AA40BNJ8_9PEZI|nr:hypothetical protein B0T21DRAFT_331655 [Apiosordaria backusii]
MTALSLPTPPQPAESHRQHAAQISRATHTAGMNGPAPIRQQAQAVGTGAGSSTAPGSISRQSVLLMAQAQALAQTTGYSSSRNEQNGIGRSVSPSSSALRSAPGPANGRLRSISPSSAARRPSSAPGNKQGVSSTNFVNGRHTDDEEDDDNSGAVSRLVKPPLLRSKSEHGLRLDDAETVVEEEIHEWGARHGFEDHYQSAAIISELANVSCVRFLSSHWLSVRSITCRWSFDGGS